MSTPFNPEQELTIAETRERDLGELISAMGNQEIKSLLLASMQPGVIYRGRDLNTLMLSKQSSRPLWAIDPKDNNLRSYCQNSLEPVGFVASAFYDPRLNRYGYLKTYRGEILGEAAAGHLLSLSIDCEQFSLQTLFGRTGTSAESGLRSPMVRIEIVNKLAVAKSKIQAKDLGLSVSAPSAGLHLRAIAQLGLIGYDSANLFYGEDYAVFRVHKDRVSEASVRHRDTDIPGYLRKFFVSKNVAEDDSDIVVGYGEIVEFLKTSVPKNVAEKGDAWLHARARQAITKVFVPQGVVSSVGIEEGVGLSTVSVSDTQRLVIERIAKIADGLTRQDPDFIAAGREKVRTILADPDAVEHLIFKAMRDSPFFNRKSREETGERIVQIIAQYPGAMTQEIVELLENGLSRASVASVLRKLEEKQTVRKEKDGQKIGWFVLETLDS